VITYFPRNFKVQDYVDIMLKSTRYFNQTASVTLTLIKRLHVIWDTHIIRAQRNVETSAQSTTEQHTHPFNSPLSRTTPVSRYQKSKTILDFTETGDSEWQWHQLDHMQVCTSFQTDNHANTPLLSFYRPDVLPFTFPVPAHPGSPGQRAVKRMCVS